MKTYGLKFGSGDPRLNTGLTPTFLIFSSPVSGLGTTPPGITEAVSGSGIYNFVYGPTAPIEFLVDAGSGLSSSDRYITGILDPIQAVDEQLTSQGTTLMAMGVSLAAMGTTLLALGGSFNALIGTTASSFGDTATDPATVFGYLKRLQEFNEGNSLFTKSTGLWDIYSRGSSTLLIEKALVDSTTSVVKT